MADIMIVDCTTGRGEVRPLTAKEKAQRDKDAQEWSDGEQAKADAASQDAADAQAWRDAVTAASSIADLKALLLGTNTPVAPVIGRKP